MKKKPTKKKKVMTKAVAIKKNTAPVLQTIKTVDDLMALAIREKSSMEQLDKLMQMKYRHEEREARKDFFQALSEFQANISPMLKDKDVAFGNTKYSHASLGQIEKQIQGPMQLAMLSKRFEIQDNPEGMTVICIITHSAGHSEKTSMAAPADTSGSKNEIQSRASTVTYLQRYTLIGALGLVTADEDNDGRNAKQTTAPDIRKTHNTKPGDVLPPVKPTSKRDAILSTLKGSWNALRAKGKKKYDDKYYASALGLMGCEKTKDCTDAQLIELTKELDIERRNAK